jgi:hypothetical protein
MFDPKARTLEGKKGLVIGIANDKSIAYGCARAFKFLNADDLAITYLNEKAKPYVQPLAEEVGASIFMPLDVSVDGQMEAVFDEITARWGRLDFALHSIAFAPKDDLHGRVVDCSKEGFLAAMEVSCYSFIRMARLAEPLMKDGGALFTMSYYGADKVIQGRPGIDVPLHGLGVGPQGHPRVSNFSRAIGNSRGLGNQGLRRAAGRGRRGRADRPPGRNRQCGDRVCQPGLRCRQTHHRRDHLHRRWLAHHGMRTEDTVA